MLNPLLHNINLSKDEYKTYSRHLILENIGLNGQKRLTRSKILFIGAGGLASSAIIYLAASGIGQIGIIDNDTVSQSNLHRQILYTQDNINDLKVKAAKLKINTINSACKVITYPYEFNNYNAFNLIKNYDLVIDTCDNFETRYIIDAVCYQFHKVHIYGAAQNFEGQVSVFNYKGGPRYSNLYPHNLNLINNNCNNTGVLGLIPGIIGLLQAVEAIKIIVGVGDILSGYMLRYNALNMSFKRSKINKKTIQEIREPHECKLNIISDKQLIDIILKNNVLIIDVRQSIEFKKSHVKNALNIPINNMKNKNSLEFIIYNCFKKRIIIYCSANSRAIIASKILNKLNIKHYRLQNGFNHKLIYTK